MVAYQIKNEQIETHTILSLTLMVDIQQVVESSEQKNDESQNLRMRIKKYADNIRNQQRTMKMEVKFDYIMENWENLMQQQVHKLYQKSKLQDQRIKCRIQRKDKALYLQIRSRQQNQNNCQKKQRKYIDPALNKSKQKTQINGQYQQQEFKNNKKQW